MTALGKERRPRPVTSLTAAPSTADVPERRPIRRAGPGCLPVGAIAVRSVPIGEHSASVFSALASVMPSSDKRPTFREGPLSTSAYLRPCFAGILLFAGVFTCAALAAAFRFAGILLFAAVVACAALAAAFRFAGILLFAAVFACAALAAAFR